MQNVTKGWGSTFRFAVKFDFLVANLAADQKVEAQKIENPVDKGDQLSNFFGCSELPVAQAMAASDYSFWNGNS